MVQFPAQLVHWAGHRAGGVRRLFDDQSGRPNQEVLKTNLLFRLEEWANSISNTQIQAPKIILLVGGPGNGKTEAIESTITWLDTAFGAQGSMLSKLRSEFFPDGGKAVPRLVQVSADCQRTNRRFNLSIVQDASVVSGASGLTAAELLVDELEAALKSNETDLYLCCVNRGVLDDALIEAIDIQSDSAQKLLEAITKAVGLSPDAPSCWPLDGFPLVAVWPMDVESLLVPLESGNEAPAKFLMNKALEEQAWLPSNQCRAGDKCPFCTSRTILANEREETSLLQILRWHELASGKRWSFRDLFSLVSYLLAGHRADAKSVNQDPCEWAAGLAKLASDAKGSARPTKDAATAIFRLVSSQYQHALFHHWEKQAGPSLARDIKDLGLENDRTAMGLQWFLSSRRSSYLPATIAPSLEGICEILDPALAGPEETLQFSARQYYTLRDLDVRFSRSANEGFEYAPSKLLSPIELELLQDLAALDEKLFLPSIRKKRPATAGRIQRLVRDFACRIVRRSLCVRLGIVADNEIFRDFQRVTDDKSGNSLADIARLVSKLLNKQQDFEISLTTTFGQPHPPQSRQAILIVPARRVAPMVPEHSNRPVSPINFLRVGSGQSSQPIALTYELFRAVRELERGMSVASLPRTILALLDTTRARLAGPIVRDPELIEQARIKLGRSGIYVEQRRSGFCAVDEEI